MVIILLERKRKDDAQNAMLQIKELNLETKVFSAKPIHLTSHLILDTIKHKSSMEFTNYLTPKMFYDDFLDWLVRLAPFHSETGRPPMSANQFYWGARIQYGCGLRVSEMLKLIKTDFDLEHRILTIRNPKTKKKGKQYTTIMPFDVKPLEKFLSKFGDEASLFPTTRSTMWKYYKNTSKIAGMKLFTIKDEQRIEGAWTHLMRESCGKMYEAFGAKESLIARKLRHSRKSGSMTMRYLSKDLNSVIEFDRKHFSNRKETMEKEIEN